MIIQTLRTLRAREAQRPRLGRRSSAAVGSVTAGAALVWLLIDGNRHPSRNQPRRPWWSEFSWEDTPYYAIIVGFNVACSQPGWQGALLASTTGTTAMLMNVEEDMFSTRTRLESIQALPPSEVAYAAAIGCAGGATLWTANRLIARFL